MSDGLFDAQQMAGLTPEQQAAKAIVYALARIKADPHVGWYCGLGTQMFALLTEAFAALNGEPVRDVRIRYNCTIAENPADKTPEAEIDEDFISQAVADHMCSSDVIEFVEGLPGVDRMELLERLLDLFCPRCGAHHPAGRLGPCGCSRFRTQHLAASIGGAR